MRETWVGKIPWRRERLPTPVFWPRKFHGLYSPWGHKELDTTERLSLSLFSAPDSSTVSNKGERGCLQWNKQHPYKRQSASQQCWIIFTSSSVQFSHSVVPESLQPHGLQHTRLPCPLPTPGAYTNSHPLSQWCHPTSHPLSSPSLPAFNLSQPQGLFKWVNSSHQVAKRLEFQLQHQSFQWIFRTDFL